MYCSRVREVDEGRAQEVIKDNRSQIYSDVVGNITEKHLYSEQTVIRDGNQEANNSETSELDDAIGKTLRQDKGTEEQKNRTAEHIKITSQR